MLVLNPEKHRMVSFAYPLQKYVLKRGIPIYSILNKKIYFRKTKNLKQVLEDAPITKALFAKEVLKNWEKQ